MGFLMVGGGSRRIRRPKALLPWRAEENGEGERPPSLASHLCTVLGEVCGSVVLVGDTALEKAALEDGGIPRIADAIPGMGPLGGLLSALEYAKDDGHFSDAWRIVLSCDTPFVGAPLLRDLLSAAEEDPAQVDAAVPRGADGRLHPLCAVYHRRLAPLLREMLETYRTRSIGEAGATRKAPSMHQFLEGVRLAKVAVSDERMFRNLNTMQEYLAALGGR